MFLLNTQFIDSMSVHSLRSLILVPYFMLDVKYGGHKQVNYTSINSWNYHCHYRSTIAGTELKVNKKQTLKSEIWDHFTRIKKEDGSYFN